MLRECQGSCSQCLPSQSAKERYVALCQRRGQCRPQNGPGSPKSLENIFFFLPDLVKVWHTAKAPRLQIYTIIYHNCELPAVIQHCSNATAICNIVYIFLFSSSRQVRECGGHNLHVCVSVVLSSAISCYARSICVMTSARNTQAFLSFTIGRICSCFSLFLAIEVRVLFWSNCNVFN